MPKKLDVLRLFAGKSLAPSDLAHFLGIEPNYARQIILRLKRQGLIFPHPTFAGGQAYSLTSKGEARIIYLAEKEKRGEYQKDLKRRLFNRLMALRAAGKVPNDALFDDMAHTLGSFSKATMEEILEVRDFIDSIP